MLKQPYAHRPVLLGILSLLFFSSFSPVARAQNSPSGTANLGAGYGPIILMSGNLTLSNNNLRNLNSSHSPTNAVRPAPAHSSSPLPLSPSTAFFYQPSQQNRRQINANLLAWLTRNDTPEQKAHATQVVESGELLNQFDTLLVDHHLSDHDMADSATLYLVIAWGVMHGKDALGNTAGIESLRHGIRTIFFERSDVTSMSDAQKQELSEDLASLASLALRAQQKVTAHNDAAGIAELQRSVQGTTSTVFGLDLAKADFTDHGLVPR